MTENKLPEDAYRIEDALNRLAIARVVAAYWQAECSRRTTKAEDSSCWPTPISVKDLAVVLRKAWLIP